MTGGEGKRRKKENESVHGGVTMDGDARGLKTGVLLVGVVGGGVGNLVVGEDGGVSSENVQGSLKDEGGVRGGDEMFSDHSECN